MKIIPRLTRKKISIFVKCKNYKIKLKKLPNIPLQKAGV